MCGHTPNYFQAIAALPPHTHIHKMTSRGANCFKSGNAYEKQIHAILQRARIHRIRIDVVGASAGATAGSDIQIRAEDGELIGVEVKNKGAFEGGCKKLTYNGSTLGITEDCIHKEILGEHSLYNGANFPYYEGKRTAADWAAVEAVFKPDNYIDAEPDTINRYYSSKGTYYIQIEGLGLYHTGNDIFELGVPEFSAAIKLRIRCTKHMKNGIPTDITAALQFDRRSIKKSPYSLDGALPPTIELA